MRLSPRSPKEKRSQGGWRTPAALLLVFLVAVVGLTIMNPSRDFLQQIQSNLSPGRRQARVLLASEEGAKLTAGTPQAQSGCKCGVTTPEVSSSDVAALSAQKEALQKQLQALKVELAELGKEKAKLAKDKTFVLEEYVALRRQLADGETALMEVQDQLSKDKALSTAKQPEEKDKLKLLAGNVVPEEKLGAKGCKEVSEELAAAKSELAQLKDKVAATEVLEASRKDASTLKSTEKADIHGYRCSATEDDMKRYLNYTVGGDCPNDWYFVQRLIFKKNCFSLPRRRCRVLTPANPTEPLPLPQSLFNQSALDNRNLRWDLHQCKSFECLNERTAGDCRQCFNLTLEETRWKGPFRGTIPMAQVIAMKNGTLRLGLDAGGGTGSFAAHMARFGVTVLTTAFNVETVSGKYAGLPYHETIAARGLVPLHVPHQSRLPFFDGVLDVIHSVNSIKYIPLVQFEELIFEWDRVLRVGGIFWFEMFYAPVDDMPKYVAIIENLGYKKLYWQFTPKTDAAELPGKEHVYLNCVLEKQPHPGKEELDVPRIEDMTGIFKME